MMSRIERVNRLPGSAEWILKHSISGEIRDRAIGDFEEIYLQLTQERNRLYAGRWIWLQVLKSLPVFLKDAFDWRLSMFTNYLKMIFRNILRNKIHYFINIAGLSIGMALFIFIAAFVLNELRHDRGHGNLNRIYQIGSGWHNGTPEPMAELLRERFPEVLRTVRFRYNFGSDNYRYKDKNFKIQRSYFVDPAVFEVFSFPMVRGNPAAALQSPYSMVLTHSAAESMFGEIDPVGEVVHYDACDLTVAGVIDDIPQNYTIQFDALISLETLMQLKPHLVGNWSSSLFQTYLLLPENHEHAATEAKMSQFMYGNYPGYEQWSPSRRDQVRFSLRPLTSLYFDRDRGGSLYHGNFQNITIFSLVAFFVLCVALFNFINLSTAAALSRRMEVGIRKVLGSRRSQLLKRFLFESIFLTAGASLIAWVMVGLLRGRFFTLIGKSIDFRTFLSPAPVLGFLVFVLFVGCAAGLYPAFYLSAFQPSDILRGGKRKRAGGDRFRKVLTIAQFAISIILIIGTFTVGRQLDFIRNRDLGFNKDQILWMELDDSSVGRAELLKSRLSSEPSVAGVGLTDFTKPGVWSIWSIPWKENKVDMDVFVVDPEYVETMGLEIVAGRDFHRESDKGRAFILNQAAVRKLGIESPIGEKIDEATLVGVVKDFNFRSLHQEISPLVLFYERDAYPIVNIRLAPGNMERAIGEIRRVWNEVLPGSVFEYHFFDESYDALYNRERKFEQLFTVFSVFAVIIACMGLFGLASFMAERRTKEIGIRKVLGASGSGIVFLLTRDFAGLVILANAVAWPAAYLVMNRWLANFAYSVRVELWLFPAAGMIALLVALLTIGFKAVVAAASDPVDSLRFE